MVPPRLPAAMLAPAQVLLALGLAAPARSQSEGDGPSDEQLAELSLEDLMDIEVSVASRHAEKLIDAPAAVYVITGDELRRQNVTSLQEALRMVPGFHVAQWRTQGFDVTARGFTGGLSSLNQSFMNQLLVMVDGVSLYSPVMAGIWWPLIDIPMADVDRIEIIRGPAGTLWGANAMNGVVHVITKHARDTQGLRLDATVQRIESSGDLRYGGTLGENGWFRTWASSTYVAGLPGERDANWSISSVGWRSDWDLTEDQRLRVLGSFYGAVFGPTYVEERDQPKYGGSLAAAWESGTADDFERLQAWFWLDHQKIPDNFTPDFEQDLQTLDLEYSRRLSYDGAGLSFGFGARAVQADMGSDDGYLDFDPERQRVYTLRTFVQGEVDVEPLDSKLIAGAQAEESTLGGFALQPNVRWLWHAAEQASVWAAVSRALRTPSIEEQDIVQRFDPTEDPIFVGNDAFGSETLIAWELGARAQFAASVSADLTVFFNDYDDLQTLEDLDGFTLTYGNRAEAEARGAELALDWNVTERWRLRSTYTYFEMDFEADEASFEASFIDDRDDLIPVHHASLRSYYDLGSDWELDAALYYVDRLPYFDIDSYVRLDARVGWRPTAGTEISIGVQNACDPRHPEAGPPEIERNVYFTLRTTF